MDGKTSASDVTHSLALLGGGAKKDGGEGMLGGMLNVFVAGILFCMSSWIEREDHAMEIAIKIKI